MDNNDMLAFDQINEFLYDLVMSMGEEYCFDTFAVALSYSYELNKDKHSSVEVFEIDPCHQTITWFNDWWEGQRYVTLIGFINVTDSFDKGHYQVLVKDFKDETDL